MTAGLRIELLRGHELSARIEALADLRVTVFREWPYLYEGTREYESHYLGVYLRSPRSLTVLVHDADRCIGATTVVPLADAGADAQRPFVEGGHAIERIDYFGESVVLPEYRGRGLGVLFFEKREAHAREHGLDFCAFCAVERPDDHPARPADYLPNDRFWQRRGYARLPGLQTTFSWPDLGATESTPKPMLFWGKRLAP